MATPLVAGGYIWLIVHSSSLSEVKHSIRRYGTFDLNVLKNHER